MNLAMVYSLAVLARSLVVATSGLIRWISRCNAVTGRHNSAAYSPAVVFLGGNAVFWQQCRVTAGKKTA